MEIIKIKTKYLGIFIGLLVLFSSIQTGYADVTIPTQIPDLDEQIDMTVAPKYPQPGTTVTITLDAYGVDLNNSEISWSNGTKTLLQGKGERILKTNAGRAGESITITATITPPNSREIQKTVSISPQSVDILWEAKTYTPPFYRGKAMFSPQEELKLFAIPNQINVAKAIYKWTEDGEVHADKSGFGVNTYKFVGDLISKKSDFVVNVSDGDGNTAENYLSIAPTDPEVYVYENSPLYGVLFNKDISTYFDIGSKQEGTVSIYPYFYGVSNRSSKKIEYKCLINGAPINVPTIQNDMTFRNTDNVSGKSKIDIMVTNIDNFLEEVQKSVIINFQKKTTDSFSL